VSTAVDTSFRRENIRRTKLLEFDCPFEGDREVLDMGTLRSGFAALFERAGQAVQRAGRDVDQVVFERFLRCRRSGGDSFDVAVEWLSDPDRLVADIRARCGAVDADDIRIESLLVVVTLEEWA